MQIQGSNDFLSIFRIPYILFIHKMQLNECFLHVYRFMIQDAFVGFQDDTPASVVFQATEQLKTEIYYNVEEEDVQSDEWKDVVYKQSCEILLQMASPDALIRLQRSDLRSLEKDLSKTYFSYQCHESLAQFLDDKLHDDNENTDGLLMQVRC